MSNEKKFIDGLIVKAPNENAPEYVKAKLSIKNAEMIQFLQARVAAGEEWTNADVKESQAGKWYAAVDSWKPKQGGGASSAPRQESKSAPAGDFDDSENIPF